ncbi:hypothetical protein PMAC_000405 [Pneumocystis sp. 'macacae']|nr:hypothetical protein PMAC_000405 [Pneumocystis sp. 'macacae']
MTYKKQHLSGRFFGLTFKLFIFFIIYKLFFVCPIEDPLGNSLLICRNYYHFRSSVDPYLKSTYHEYAMEHVETVLPYLKNIQKNVNKYGKPIAVYIKNKYKKYVHPYVLYMRDCTYQYIQKHIQPVGMKYFKLCNKFYKDKVKKYIVYFDNIYWKSLYPSIHISTQMAYNFYKSKLITFYQHAKPYVIQLLKSIYLFCRKEVYPRIIQVLFKFKDFFFTYIVPKFNLLWETHVKPQLERIYDRIFQYKEIDPDTLRVQSGSSLNRNTYSKEFISKQKYNAQTPNYIDNQLISEMLSLWTDNLNRISKGIEKLLIDDLVNVLLPIIYKKEKATIQNLLAELNLLMYDKYFNFETLINTIEKQLFDSVLNSTLSSLKQIRNLSIKAEITLNNIAGLAARQLKDFKSVNASNTIIQKLYNDSVNENHAFSQKIFKESHDKIVRNKQENNKTESENSILNTKSSIHIKVQEKKMPWRLSRTRKLRQRRRLRKVDLVISTLQDSLSKNGLTCRALERHIREITPEAKMRPKDKYTVFDKKKKEYRKGIHFVPKLSLVYKSNCDE